MISALGLRLLAITAMLGLLAAAIGGVHHHGVKEGRSEVQAKWDKQTAELNAQALEQSQENRRLEQRSAVRAGEIAHDTAVQMDHARVVAVRARADGDSLRSQLAAVQSSAAATAADASRAADAIATLSRQLGECSGQLQEMASRADAASVQVTGLQEFVKAEREPAP
jgi:chromosome segregation ATPase